MIWEYKIWKDKDSSHWRDLASFVITLCTSHLYFCIDDAFFIYYVQVSLFFSPSDIDKEPRFHVPIKVSKIINSTENVASSNAIHYFLTSHTNFFAPLPKL